MRKNTLARRIPRFGKSNLNLTWMHFAATKAIKWRRIEHRSSRLEAGATAKQLTAEQLRAASKERVRDLAKAKFRLKEATLFSLTQRLLRLWIDWVFHTLLNECTLKKEPQTKLEWEKSASRTSFGFDRESSLLSQLICRKVASFARPASNASRAESEHVQRANEFPLNCFAKGNSFLACVSALIDSA